MKAILVIDMPSDCWKCPMHIDGLDDENEEIMVCNAKARESHYGEKPSWCPLKPIPKKEIVLERKINGVTANYLEMAEARIRNRVIDEILGKGETE